MNIDIVRLKNGIVDYIEVSEELNISQELLSSSSIISMDKITVEGEIYRDDDDYELYLELKGTMVLPCSISLKPVKHEFDIKINQNYYESLEEIQKNVKKSNNTIDILPILWENILVEIPIRITDPESDIVTSGDGWRLVSEDEVKTNLALEKLEDILE